MRILEASLYGGSSEGRIEVPQKSRHLIIPHECYLGLEPPSDFFEIYLTLLKLRNRYQERSLSLKHPDGWEPYRSDAATYIGERVGRPEISVRPTEDYFVMGLDDIGKPLIPSRVHVTEKCGDTCESVIRELMSRGYKVESVTASIPQTGREVRPGVHETLSHTSIRTAPDFLTEKNVNERKVILQVGGNALPRDIEPFLDGFEVEIKD